MLCLECSKGEGDDESKNAYHEGASHFMSISFKRICTLEMDLKRSHYIYAAKKNKSIMRINIRGENNFVSISFKMTYAF